MKLLKWTLGICILPIISQCNKPNTDVPATQSTNQLVISAIAPTHGPYNTIDTISGTGFDPNASNDSVFFNGHYATILNATSTRLIVQVPLLAGTGNVNVKINSTLNSGPVFKYDTTTYISTLAGTGSAGFANGTGSNASFNGPSGIAVDANGNVYVADYTNMAMDILQTTSTIK